MNKKRLRMEQSLEVIERIEDHRDILRLFEKRIANGEKRRLTAKIYQRKTEYMRRLEHLLWWIQTDDWASAMEVRNSFKAEDDQILLEPFQDQVKKPYVSWQYLLEYFAGTAGTNETEKQILKESFWTDTQKAEVFYCSISEKGTGSFIGYCVIRDMSDTLWQIEVEMIDSKKWNQYAVQAICLFTDRLAETAGMTEYKYIVQPEDTSGINLMKKIGADLRGIIPLCKPGEKYFQNIVDQRKHLLTKDLIAIAEQLNVDEKQVLAGLLEYRITIRRQSKTL